MKGRGIKNIVVKFVGWLLLLQMINISIDPPNFKLANENGNTANAHLPLNITESIYELLSESVFGKDVPEDEQKDIEKFEKSIDLFYLKPTFTKFSDVFYAGEHCGHYLNRCPVVHSTPNIPPPKI